MIDLVISSLSLEAVKLPVHATVLGQAYNPTGDVVQMAFTAVGVKPVSGDWKTAVWETATGTRTEYLATCLVGPAGAVTLAAGEYQPWVRIVDNPETIVKAAPGTLRVT